MLCALLAAAGSGGNCKSELLSVLPLAESACAGIEAAQAKQAATANTVASRDLCIVRFPVDVVKGARQTHPGIRQRSEPGTRPVSLDGSAPGIDPRCVRAAKPRYRSVRL